MKCVSKSNEGAGVQEADEEEEEEAVKETGASPEAAEAEPPAGDVAGEGEFDTTHSHL
jgi:hypothetical protein